MEKNTRNKEIQRARIFGYFLNSAKEIYLEEGFHGLTIRNVSYKAGYNSATMYNYFDNIDHLKLCTSLTVIEPFVQELLERLKKETTSIERYRIFWINIAAYGFENYELFHSLWSPMIEGDLEYYMDEYFSYYPSKTSKEMKMTILSSLMNSKMHYLMKCCIKDGFFTEKEGKMIDELIRYVFESLLVRSKHQKNREKLYREFISYLSFMIGFKEKVKV